MAPPLVGLVYAAKKPAFVAEAVGMDLGCEGPTLDFEAVSKGIFPALHKAYWLEQELYGRQIVCGSIFRVVHE